jgi:hypothetical protein
VSTYSHYLASLRGTSLTAQVWVYSSQELSTFSGLPDLLLGHGNGLGCEGAVVHLGIVEYVSSFTKC